MLLGIYYARTEGKAGNRREGKGRAGQGKGWKGGEEGQHKQKNSTIAWRLWENDFGQEEEQHVIRVRRDGKVAALAGTRQRTTQEPAANHTRRHETKKHTRISSKLHTFRWHLRGFHFVERIHKLNNRGGRSEWVPALDAIRQPEW